MFRSFALRISGFQGLVLVGVEGCRDSGLRVGGRLNS